MISDFFAIFAVIVLCCVAIFISWNVKTGHLRLIHKLYMAFAASYGVVLLSLLGMKFVDPTNTALLFVLDACSNTAGTWTPTLYLCISLAFLRDWQDLSHKRWLLFLMPIINMLIVWTDPLHHLEYKVFSIVKSEVVFGPYLVISGAYSYICLMLSIIMMINFAARNRTRIYMMQCGLFALGGVVPLVVSLASTTTSNLSITATPMSFTATLVFNGIAIYRLHMFDIKPLATQLVLDSISDSYMILSETGIVVSWNKPFEETFSRRCGLQIGTHLDRVDKMEDGTPNTVVYNIRSAISSCKSSSSPIFYEQPIITVKNGKAAKNYYIAEVSPVLTKNSCAGLVVIFKDVTQLRVSMQQLQDNQARMMEQERLAFLGQMIGGLAHNLKTPIMSISGCLCSLEALVTECRDSLRDPEVLPEDYEEIYGEMENWCQKVRESASYMSDIITAIKGQAASAVTVTDATFSVDELFKRVTLLMRHELYTTSTQLLIEYENDRYTTVQGDINSLIQVLDNFISNSLFAQNKSGKIVLGVRRDEEKLKIYVKDFGPGVNPKIKDRLFREMVTTKGIHGTGLGLMISEAVVQGNFGGSLWYEDNPQGGAIFGITLPGDRIQRNQGLGG